MEPTGHKMVLKVFLFLGALSFVTCSNEIGRSSEAIDSSFLENVLDEEECNRQIEAIISSPVHLLEFLDAGIKIPRGIFTGNLVDLGNYHQCLAMKQDIEGVHVEGKYCSILIPLEQDDLAFPENMSRIQFDASSMRLNNETISKIKEYNLVRRELQALSGKLDGLQHDRSIESNLPIEMIIFRLGVCVPKPCTTKSILNLTELIGLRYYEDYCRLPGDKPWAPADFTAVCILGALGLLTFVSTCYDLCYRFIMNKDVKQMSILGRSFSVYTNGIRLTTFSDSGGTLQCLDGIRTLAMLWVIVGHSYSSESFLANPLDSQAWMFSASALWITAATMTVDTFFTITGVLLVYTTAEKMTQRTFLKNLHWFYLNRYIRLTPLLAVAVLLQASFMNRIADGPYWQSVAYATETCRTNWWTTLLHVQNLVNVDDMCIEHSWYVAIDFQLFVISPLVLLWVLSGKKLYAWIGLVGALALVLGGSTIYTFHINVPAGNLVPTRYAEMGDYLRLYYFFTLTRASPFFVGLVFGYILHLYRHKKLYLPWPIAILFWLNALSILGGIFFFKFSIKQIDWDNELMDNLMNSFMRPAYACAICWIITACAHGYGGPINWLLSHEAWRLPARLTYGMYLFHYPLMYSINGASVAPTFFSVEGFALKFVSLTVVSFVWSFFFTLLVDSPITVLFKQLTGSAKKTTPINNYDEPAEVDMEENIESAEGIRRNMEIVDEDDDVNSESDENLSQSSSSDTNSEGDDIASYTGSDDVNSESSQPDPNDESHSRESVVEASTSHIDSSNKLGEPNTTGINFRDETIEPVVTVHTNSSDKDVEANTAGSNSGNKVVEPNPASIESTDTLVEPNASRSDSKRKIDKPNVTTSSIKSSYNLGEPSVSSSDKTVEPNAASINANDRTNETNTDTISSFNEPSISHTDSTGNDSSAVDSNTNVTSENAPDTVPVQIS